MKNENEVKEKPARKKASYASIVLIAGLIIILIPCIAFLTILYRASQESNTPVIGERYENDLDPAISEEQLNTVVSKLSSISGVEKVSWSMTTAQLRVNVDVKDSLGEEEVLELTETAYATLSGILPAEKYFTKTATKKMYDLQLNVFTEASGDNGKLIYYCLVKNSTMEEAKIELLSSPKDAELAKELRGEVDEPVPEEAPEAAQS